MMGAPSKTGTELLYDIVVCCGCRHPTCGSQRWWRRPLPRRTPTMTRPRPANWDRTWCRSPGTAMTPVWAPVSSWTTAGGEEVAAEASFRRAAVGGELPVDEDAGGEQDTVLGRQFPAGRIFLEIDDLQLEGDLVPEAAEDLFGLLAGRAAPFGQQRDDHRVVTTRLGRPRARP